MKKIKIIYLAYGLVNLVALSMTTLIMFFSAFLNESKSMKIYINRYGEAIPELYALIVGIPFMLYFIWWATIKLAHIKEVV